MKIVYYAPAVPPEFYGNDFMLHQTPDSLYKDILIDKNEDNDYNNYMDCPAYLKAVHNTFVVRNPWNITLNLDYKSGVFLNAAGNTDAITEHFCPKPNSRNKTMFNMYHNYLFFCDDSLEITTTPAYMHNTELQSKCTYIPGSFDINKWFRPIEGAYEMQTNFDTLSIKTGDPMYYIKFNTSEPVKLVRFDLTPDLWNMSEGCVYHKKYQPGKALTYLYKLFTQTGMRSKISKHIKDNIIK